MQSWHIHISGRVQGVGFRPFVYRLATSLNLKGRVQNGMDGVYIDVNADEEMLLDFCQKIKANAPAVAQIGSITYAEADGQEFTDFDIVPSEQEGQANLLITPDLAICESCRQELHDPKNRRYQYPFITCTQCGPRYSILKSLPFDRENTSMRSFHMCPECMAEYTCIDSLAEISEHEVKDNSRYHAQTNSCGKCGIKLSLYKLNPKHPYAQLVDSQAETLIKKISQLLLGGNIVAVKGIGGYLLMADAGNEEVVQRLRQRKGRPAKPFALMYPSLEAVRQDVYVSEKEVTELLSYRSPIVLLKLKKRPASGIALQQIAPDLAKLGIMLPYTPLFELILKAVKKPLIATSANLSGSPIFYKDEDALEELNGIADYVLINNREICLPQDDSVMQFTTQHQQAIILRRSRGLAPAYRPPERSKLADLNCLAMGVQQKSSFALVAHQQLYLSQYLGELSNYHTAKAYQQTLAYFLQLCQAEPQFILADLHPDYFATQLGQRLAEEKNIPIYYVQHHRAHFGAVLTENSLLETDEPVLGVIWDGTGLGDDRQIWGGEFFTFAERKINRTAHLAYFPHRFGDKMASEPRLSLLCLADGDVAFDETLKTKFSAQEWTLYQKMICKKAAIQTSSIGRLFDAVASLLGLCDVNLYESQAAMFLEQHAAAYLHNHSLKLHEGYPCLYRSGEYNLCLTAMLEDMQKGRSCGEMAARFHLGLVNLIKKVAEKEGIKQLAFSGGVFQNALLIDLIITHLQSDFKLYFHQQLSPNDESIPLGQIACHWIRQEAQKNVGVAKNFQTETLNF